MTGEFKVAITYCHRNLEIHEQLYGYEHHQTAWALGFLGSAYSYLGDFVQAKQCIGQSHKLYQKLNKTSTSDYALTLSNLGVIQYQLSRTNTDDTTRLLQLSYFALLPVVAAQSKSKNGE